MKAYKGFAEDLTCRGFQYEDGKTYEHDGLVSVCESGFHACESPLEVFGYYPPATSVYREVDLEGVSESRDGDSKRAARNLTVTAKISLAGLAKAHVEYVSERLSEDAPKATVVGNTASNTGDRSAASNTGDRSAASNTGHQSAASNTGHQSAATNTGNYSAATNTGNRSAATNTGNWSAATNTGAYSAATNTGDRSAASNTGYRSAASNTGDRSAATVSGKESVAIVTGKDSKASGALGCWIVLTERDADWNILEVKAFKVDGKKIKADTYYRLAGGKLEVAS